MDEPILALKQVITQKRQQGNWDMQPFHWHYLEGFVAALDEPFEIREAKARLNFYQNVPIYILPGEYIVGQIDWNEPLSTYVSNTQIRNDILEKIRQSDLPESEKQKVNAWVEEARPFCLTPGPI